MNQEAFGNAVTDKAPAMVPIRGVFQFSQGLKPRYGAAFEAGWYQATFFMNPSGVC